MLGVCAKETGLQQRHADGRNGTEIYFSQLALMMAMRSGRTQCCRLFRLVVESIEPREWQR